MKSTESEPEEAVEKLVEHADAPTTMDYDHGSVPIYIAVAWVIFLGCYLAYMVVYGLPDFTAWSAR